MNKAPRRSRTISMATIIHLHGHHVTRFYAAGTVVSVHQSRATMTRPRFVTHIALTAIAVVLAGCATVTGTPTQAVSIQTVDANNRPIEGMRCRIANSAADYVGDSPLFDLKVRRSSSDLEVECRRGALTARGTAVSRGTHLLSMVLPGGTAAMIVDHVSGYRYSYPSTLHLRVGEHLVFDPSAIVPAKMSVDADLDLMR